jgi:hypothetical protein
MKGAKVSMGFHDALVARLTNCASHIHKAALAAKQPSEACIMAVTERYEPAIPLQCAALASQTIRPYCMACFQLGVRLPRAQTG